MNRLKNSLAKKTNNFEKVDKEYAYAVWILEKEFHVGAITESFPVMKFWNLLDKYNMDRYKRDMNNASKGKRVTMR